MLTGWSISQRERATKANWTEELKRDRIPHFSSYPGIFSATGQESNWKSALLPGPKSSDFLLLTLLGTNINLITSQLMSYFISLCLVHLIREPPFKKTAFCSAEHPPASPAWLNQLLLQENRLWQKQFCTQTLQTLLLSTCSLLFVEPKDFQPD